MWDEVYEERLESVKNGLIADMRRKLTYNWERMFDMWLSMEADLEFGESYKKRFIEQFERYMDEDIENLLWFAGQNLLFAITSYWRHKKNASLNDVINYAEGFIKSQIGDFDNWCEEIRSRMYEESSDYERDQAELHTIQNEAKEDNPN